MSNSDEKNEVRDAAADAEADHEQQFEKFVDDVDAQSRARIKDSVKRLFEDADKDEDAESSSQEFLEYDEEWDDKTPVEDGYIRVKEDEESYTIRGKDLERLLRDLDADGDFVDRAYSKDAISSDDFSNVEAVGPSQSNKSQSDVPDGGNEQSDYYEQIADALKDGTREKKDVMKYFDDRNKQYMPSWLKEAYENGDEEIFSGPKALRLDADAVKQQAPTRKRGKIEDSEKMAVLDASTIAEVAEDFRVPVEFVLDEVAALGARKPILPTDILEDRLLDDEIGKLTEVLTTFDYVDLCERYSDRSLREIAASYELDVDDVEDICGAEGIELCLGADTHLLKIREEQLVESLEAVLSRRRS